MGCRMPTPVKRAGSQYYWLRKRVPERYRAIVGKGEVWKSLQTSHLKQATALCAAASLDLEEVWEARLIARQSGLPDPVTRLAPVLSLSHKDRIALAGVAYKKTVEARSENPGSPFRWLAAKDDDDDPERDRKST